jgi:hypothetical protein
MPADVTALVAKAAAYEPFSSPGGGAILHHRHIRPVLIREWSPKMDGIAGTIWASQTTIRPCRRDNV